MPTRVDTPNPRKRPRSNESTSPGVYRKRRVKGRSNVIEDSESEDDGNGPKTMQVFNHPTTWQPPPLKNCFQQSSKVLVIYLCSDAHAYQDYFYVVPALDAIICKKCQTPQIAPAHGAVGHFTNNRFRASGEKMHPPLNRLRPSSIRRILLGFHAPFSITQLPIPPWWCSSIGPLPQIEVLQCPACGVIVHEDYFDQRGFQLGHKCHGNKMAASFWNRIKAHQWQNKGASGYLPIHPGGSPAPPEPMEQQTHVFDPWQQIPLAAPAPQIDNARNDRYETSMRQFLNVTLFGTFIRHFDKKDLKKLVRATRLRYETETEGLGGTLVAWVDKTFELLQDTGVPGIGDILVMGSRQVLHQD